MKNMPKRFILVTGMLLVVGLLITYHLLLVGFTKKTSISCHSLKSSATQAEYCVYHSSKPSLLGSGYELLIGLSPNRGIVYEIPYSIEDTKVAWNKETDSLTVTMPGTKLIIESGEYIDSR